MSEFSSEEIHKFLIDNTVFAMVFLALGIVLTWIGYIRGFFSLPYREYKGPPVKFYDVLAVFGIFLFAYGILAPLVWWLFSAWWKVEKYRPLSISLVQFVVFSFTALLFFLYSYFRNRDTMRAVWKDTNFPNSQNIYSDLALAWIALVIAAPIVLAVAHLSEVIRVLILGYSQVEQLAVRYLKLAVESPSAMMLAFVSILVFAPFLEEFLFRGVLQSWFRQKFGSFAAIFLTATCFGLFHFSTSQSSTNIPLILTLVAFSCYLGFLYEKTRSLFSPIFLHVTFNCISVIRIIFNDG